MIEIPFGMNNLLNIRSIKRILQRGLSIIEILLAIGVLGAVMIPVMLTFSSSNQGITMTVEEFIAHTAAIELLEQTMAVPFDMLPVGVYEDDQIKDGKYMSPGKSELKFRISKVDDLDLKRELIITPLEKNGKIKFKKVEVKVSWTMQDGKGAPRTLVVKGLLANEAN